MKADCRLSMFFRANELLSSSETSAKVKLLGDFHPNGPGLNIPDPETEKDPKAYETTYWLVWNFYFNLFDLAHFPQIYKSMRELIKHLKAEAEACKPKKPLKLHDPTIFTVTSPSAWQRNKLTDPADQPQPSIQMWV